MSLRVVTAGESHGPGLTCLVEGLPAGLELDRDAINRDMARRQLGHGRGGRMKIERDAAEVTAGRPPRPHARRPDRAPGRQPRLRQLGGADEPVAGRGRVPEVHLPRPGHADLAGRLKFGFTDVRNVLERASARETAARVAGGALAKAFLRARRRRGRLARHPDRLRARAGARRPDARGLRRRRRVARPLPGRRGDARRWSRRSTCCASATSRSAASSRCARSALVPGLGSHVSLGGAPRRPDRAGDALDPGGQGLSGSATASTSPGRPGSEAHDEIFYSDERGYYRETNRSGGLEGGMTTGEPLVVRAAMKPLPTLTKPLRSVDISTHEPAQALRERTDSAVVPAAGVVGEAMLAIVLAGAYRREVRRRPHRRRAAPRSPPTRRGSAGSGGGRTARARLHRLHGRRQDVRGPRRRRGALGARAVDTDHAHRGAARRARSRTTSPRTASAAFREAEEEVVCDAARARRRRRCCRSAAARSRSERVRAALAAPHRRAARRRRGDRLAARRRPAPAGARPRRASTRCTPSAPPALRRASPTRAARLPRATPSAARCPRCASSPPPGTRMLWARSAVGRLPGLRRRRRARHGVRPVAGRALPVTDDERRRALRRRGWRRSRRDRVPPGEAAKTLASAGRCCARWPRAGIDHDDHVVALGGGVVGDVAGFCAAVYQRGVAGRPGADDARRPGRLRLRRQDRRRPAGGQELRRRLPPAGGGAGRPGRARDAARARSSPRAGPRWSRPR